MKEFDFLPATPGSPKLSVLLTDQEWDFISQLIQRGAQRKQEELSSSLPCLAEGPDSTICYLPFKHTSPHHFQTEHQLKEPSHEPSSPDSNPKPST